MAQPTLFARTVACAIAPLRTFARHLPRSSALAVLSAALMLAAPSSARPLLGGAERENLTRAIAAAEEGSHHFAASLARNVGDPVAQTLVRWIDLTRGSNDYGFSTYRDFIADHSDWPYLQRLQVRAEEALSESVPAAEIRAFFEHRQPITRPGKVHFAQALLQAGDEARAVALLRDAWITGDFGAREQASFLARHGHRLDRGDHVARLEHLLWHGQTGAAERMLPHVDDIRGLIATARIRLQRDLGGVDAAIARVPAAHRGDPGLTFDRARWRRDKGFDDGAVELLREARAEGPRPDLWWSERHRQVRRLLREGRHREAYALAASHGQDSGLPFAEGEFLAGWLALRFLDRPADAFDHFRRLHDGVGTPISLSRGAYWAGRAADALGDDALAARWYARGAEHGTAFYGQLAAEELADRGQPVMLPASAAMEMPSASAREAFERRGTVKAVRLIAQTPHHHLKLPFVMRLTADASSMAELALVIELTESVGRPDLMVRAGRAAASSGLVDEAASFPIPGVRGLIQPVGGEPDPTLLLAIARQESLFDPRAISRAGARGILQLMPGTAEGVARALDLPYSPSRLLSDPEYNARLGAHYLREQLGRFGGELPFALAAYNAGPQRVARWREEYGDPSGRGVYAMLDWMESIPFAETRNYVQRVLEARTVYARRLADPGHRVIAFAQGLGPRDS